MDSYGKWRIDYKGKLSWVVLIFLFLFFSGCGLLQSYLYPQWVKLERSLGRDPDHIYSCGPAALKKAFERLGIEISQEAISDEIRRNGNGIRAFLSIFDKEARQITLPGEMKEILRKNGFRMTKVDSFNKIDTKNSTTILLVHKKNTFDYHWICYPANKFHYFGERTVLDTVYLIEKIL